MKVVSPVGTSKSIPPAPTPTTDDLVGVVEQTGGAKETPQEKAARERAEMATEGKL